MSNPNRHIIQGRECNSSATLMEGLTISEASGTDTQDMGLAHFAADRKLFLLSSAGFSGYVVALAVAWHEDELEYYDKSPFDFSTFPGAKFSLFSRLFLAARIRFAMLVHNARNSRKHTNT